MTTIDFTSEVGERVLDRLRNEQVIWLTTVDRRGRPLSRPVWFLWRDGHFEIYSQPAMPKLRSIAQNEYVALNFNSSETGDDVVIFEGTAEIVREYAPGTDDPAYVEKYTRLIDGWTPDDFAATFSVHIRVTLTSMRAH